MRNWYEMYVFGREKASEFARVPESIRMARTEPARLAKGARPTVTVVRLEKGRATGSARATLVLQRDEVISIRARRRPYLITCIAGSLWTTIDRSLVDAVLVADESVTYRDRGRIVIQALRTATVRIECPNAAQVVVGSPLRPLFQLG